MRDLNFDWCFEGGCTYVAGTGLDDELDTEELEVMYREPCIAMAD